MKLTNRESAAIIWNTMYPDRRPFDKLEEDTKVEWERLVEIANSVFRLNGLSEKKFTNN